MKRFILLFAFAIIGFSATAQSSIIKANPFGLAFGAFNACYEKTIGEKSSFLISANYFGGSIGDNDVSAFGAGVGYRMYLTAKEAPRGFYVMPNVGFSSGNESVFSTDQSYTALSFGADLGYQWVWDSGFALDLGVGPTYAIYSGDGITLDNGIVPSLVLAIGIAL